MRKRIREEIFKEVNFNPPNFKVLTYVLIVTWIVVGDQLVKYLAMAHRWTASVCNSRFAFSLGPDLGLLNAVVVAFILMLTVFVATRTKRRITQIGLMLIIGGGLSNFVDRVIGDGCVLDIFHSGWFPSFNIADSAITVGVIFVIITNLRGRRRGTS